MTCRVTCRLVQETMDGRSPGLGQETTAGRITSDNLRSVLQGKQALSYQVECFGGAVLNYSTYDKELYPPVQAMNKWVEARIG